MRKTAVLVLALVLVVLMAVPALAAVTKSGTKNCSAYQTGVSRSYSTGVTEHFPPGSGYVTYNNGTTWKVRTGWGATGGGWWMVRVTSGSLNDPGTYAYCSNIS